MTPRRNTSGLIFVVALFLLAGISVILIALASEVSLDLHMSNNLCDADEATELAKTGLDTAVYLADTTPNWRQAFPSGVWTTRSAGGGTITIAGTGTGGTLTSNTIDPVTASATAVFDGTTRTYSATLLPPVHDALMYLAYAQGTDQEIRFESTCRVYGDLCSADQINLISGSPDHRGRFYVSTGSKITPALKDSNSPVTTYKTAPVAPTPDFNWFITRGSQITPPINGSYYEIADKIISPTSNPYGFTNANGIYYITANGHDLKFTRCQIQGTLIIQTNRKVIFDKACVHAPASSSMPAIISDKEIVYQFDQNLSESESSVDFNNDGDRTDTFTPSVSGIVYAADKITGLQATGGTNICRFKGTLISPKITFTGTGSIFEQDPALSTTLINQFHGTGLNIVPGTIKWNSP